MYGKMSDAGTWVIETKYLIPAIDRLNAKFVTNCKATLKDTPIGQPSPQLLGHKSYQLYRNTNMYGWYNVH